MVTVDDGTELIGEHVILASGSVPRTIPGFEVDGAIVMTSDEVLALDRLPESAVGDRRRRHRLRVRLHAAPTSGSQVTILEALPKLLPGCDKDVVDVVARSFKKRGIDVRTGVAVSRPQAQRARAATGTTVLFGDGEELAGRSRSSSRSAAGRCRTAWACEGTGVEVDERGFVKVDEYMRTGEPGVFAVGDLVATPALAHVGFAEGVLVIDQILGDDVVPVDYGKVPVVHLLPPRGGLRRATPRRRPARPATTWSPRRTLTAATAGP